MCRTIRFNTSSRLREEEILLQIEDIKYQIYLTQCVEELTSTTQDTLLNELNKQLQELRELHAKYLIRGC